MTHTCHNAFADSCSPDEPLHGGLSDFGHSLIREMNRIGMIVDVSHTSNSTQAQSILASRAPVLFTHSSSKALFPNAVRNVEDSTLSLFNSPNPFYKRNHHAGNVHAALGTGGVEEGPDWAERDGFVGATAMPAFVGLNGTVQDVADHIEHLASVAGRHRVGLGTDFDGFIETPLRGLQDVSQYPNLFAVLHRRGWTRKELIGLAGGNFLRVWRKIEAIRDTIAAENGYKGGAGMFDIYEKRPDMGRSGGW